MEFTDLISRRRSCHYFQPGYQIEEKVFFRILEYVRLSPSGYNAQPWQFVLIQSPEMLQAVYDIAFEQKHILESGNVVAVLGNTDFGMDECGRICQEWRLYRHFTEKQVEALQASLLKERPESQKREMVIRNTSLAAMTFLYAAENEGLITCPMMGFSQKKLSQLLKLEDAWIPIMLIALGKSDPDRPEPQRLPRKKGGEIGRVVS